MAGTQRITLLQHISHEEPEGKKWQVNDVAKISTKLLMSSFYTSVDNKIYVSIYSAEGKKVQEKHKIEISTQREPNSVLLTEDGSIIVVCVGMNIQFYKARYGTLQKTVVLEAEPSCICRAKNELLVATDNSSTIQIFNFEAIQTKKVALEGLDQSEYPSDMTMGGDRIYLCTQKTGQALSYDQNGAKRSAFKSNDEQNSKASSIEFHREKKLVFILWNNCYILVYSHLSNESLFSVDTTCATKMRLIDDHMMILKVPETKEILVYDVETLIDFAMLKEQFLATLKEEVRKSMLTESKSYELRQSLSSSKSSFNRKVCLKILQQQKDLFRTFDAVQIQYANYNAKQETTGGLTEQVQTETLIDFAMLKEQFLATLKEEVRNDLLTDSKPHEPRKSESSSKSSRSDTSKLKKAFSFRKNNKPEQQKKLLKLLDELQIKYENYKANMETEEIKTAESALEKSEKTNLVLEEEMEDKDTRPLEEERKIEGQKTSLLSSSEMIKEQEDMSTELKGQQKILKEIWVQVKEKLKGEERSSDQVLTNLKKLEEMNKKLDDEVTQLKERLLAEGKRAKEVITSTTKLSEEMKGLESKRTELVSQQQKFKDDFIQERKDNIAREERSRVQIVTKLKEVIEAHTKLEDGLTQLKERMPAEENTTKEVKTSSVKGMLPRFLSDAQLDKPKCQRDTASYVKDELESVVAESVDTGIYSSNSTSTSHFVNPFVGNGEQLNPDLKVAVTVTVKGAHMHIPDTGVELDIPKGAIRQKRLIEMTIIPFDKQFAPIEKFSSNASVVVELLPNKAIFDMPVHLKLPHCLQLKKNYKEIKNHVKVFVSHHEAGLPNWKEDSSAKCTLEEDHCVIRLKQFCWVKYEINDKIVVAKRLKVFTAGKSLRPNDSIAEIEVGYYMDLPGRAENMTASLGIEFCQNKPFVFLKDGELSLQLVLSKIVPNEWTYITPDDNPKTISYKSVADDKDTSCPFALEKSSSSSERKPYCIFKIVQGNESVELSMRF